MQKGEIDPSLAVLLVCLLISAAFGVFCVDISREPVIRSSQPGVILHKSPESSGIRGAVQLEDGDVKVLPLPAKVYYTYPVGAKVRVVTMSSPWFDAATKMRVEEPLP